jgi:hypothetical protein
MRLLSVMSDIRKSDWMRVTCGRRIKRRFGIASRAFHQLITKEEVARKIEQAR